MANVHTVSGWPFLSALRGVDDVVFLKWNEREGKGRSLFNVRDSTQYQEDNFTVGGGGIMPQKLEGQPLTYDSLNEGFRSTFTHLDYGLAKRITRNLLRDELHPILERIGTETARQARATEETLLANHYNRAFNTSYTGPDGQVLCATAHVREDGSTYANRPTSDADLSQTSLEQGFIDFSDFRDGGGKRISIEPAHLVVAKENRFEAHRLLMSSQSPENDTNAVNPLDGLVQACVWNYLTDADAWFLQAEKEDHGLVLYVREEFWTDYEFDWDSKDYKFSGMFAQSSGWIDPRGFYGTEGA